MSIEVPPSNELNQEIFDEAYERMKENDFDFAPSKNTAKGFVIEVNKRNIASHEAGEEDYVGRNITATINQFSDIDGSNADGYRFIAGSYFGQLNKLKVANNDLNKIRAEVDQAEILAEARKMELIHEHGEERADQILKDSE